MTRSTDVHREAWVGRARDADLLENAVRCGAVLKRFGKEHTGPCPWCGGTDRFSINPVKAKWHCRGHGGGGDAIGMVMHIAGLSFLEAVQDITGEPPPSSNLKPLSETEKAARNRQRQESEAHQQARKAQEKEYQEDTREAALMIWEASCPVAGTLAETYLAGRGLVAFEGNVSLRFHPALKYPGKTSMPAMVCRVDDLAGNLCAVWRIFLGKEGKKAEVGNAKLGLGPAGGGAVRLGGLASHIGLAEGVETALAAASLTGNRIPIWAALSTAGLIGFEVPLGVSRVTIFPDGDRPLRRAGNEYQAAVPAGRKAAHSLFARLIEEGIRASIAAEPLPGKDYNDLWLEQIRDEA